MLRLLWSRALSFLEAEIHPCPLAGARALTGAAAIIKAWLLFELLSVLSDKVRLPVLISLPLPPPWLPTGLMALAGFGLLLGLGGRTPAALLAGISGYLLLLDQQLYSNHLYLLALVAGLLVLGDPRARWSVLRRKLIANQGVSAWPAALICLQVSIVYVFAGLSKLNAEYLSGRVVGVLAGSGPAVVTTPRPSVAVAVVVSVLGIGVEIWLGAALWSRRRHQVAIAVGLGAHASFVFLLPQPRDLIVFGLLMATAYPLYLPVRDALTRVAPSRMAHGE